MAVALLILGLVLFVGLVVVHEWGHFIMARRNGVDVEEFGIGFPPRLWKKRIKSKKGDYDFTLNLLPVGGFVKLKGEHDSDTEPGTFGAASTTAKTKIMAAGVVMNLVTAFVLLTLLAIAGMPKLIDNQFTIANDTHVVSNQTLITFVEKDSPASKAGLQVQDRILSIGKAGDETKLSSSKDLPAVTKKYAGQPVAITFSRDGQVKHATATIRTAKEVNDSRNTDSPKGYLGVAPTNYTVQRSTWSAPVVAVGLIGQFTKLTFQGLGTAVAGVGKIIAGTATGNSEARTHGQAQASEQVSGPVGIFVILRDGSSLGINFVLLIIAIISLTLAIMNILPIPALDGGRLWLTLLTRGINRPLSQEREELINASGFVFLMVLILLITVVDVRRFF